jgi:hypothetical protein
MRRGLNRWRATRQVQTTIHLDSHPLRSVPEDRRPVQETPAPLPEHRFWLCSTLWESSHNNLGDSTTISFAV